MAWTNLTVVWNENCDPPRKNNAGVLASAWLYIGYMRIEDELEPGISCVMVSLGYKLTLRTNERELLSVDELL